MLCSRTFRLSIPWVIALSSCVALAPEGSGASERREFVQAFTQKLLNAYGRTVRATGDEKVAYERETTDGKYSSVETRVSSSGGETAIGYRLHAVEGQWKVYDVVIENVSIVNNYRAQFDRVIAKSSVQELLQKIKQQDS